MRRALLAGLLALAGCISLDDLLDDQLLWKFERRDSYQLPDDEAAATRELFAVSTRDGVRIHGLWLPAAPGARSCTPAVLYCQGQSGDLQDHYAQLKTIRDLGYDVLTFDYRGNGMSEGKTTEEEHTYVDAEAAAEEIRRRAPAQPIVYYGESLGGAVCAELALRARPDRLHLDCTFASIDLFVKDGAQLPIPGTYLTNVRYDTISKIGRVGTPVQLFHGAVDDFVRSAHSVALYDAAADPKELWLVPDADHGTDRIQLHAEYDDRLAPFVDGACRP
jgi:fermentation-respiration switch protein FrsA (DUF1100 family)